jgi:hypothetical protein
VNSRGVLPKWPSSKTKFQNSKNLFKKFFIFPCIYPVILLHTRLYL